MFTLATTNLELVGDKNQKNRKISRVSLTRSLSTDAPFLQVKSGTSSARIVPVSARRMLTWMESLIFVTIAQELTPRIPVFLSLQLVAKRAKLILTVMVSVTQV